MLARRLVPSLVIVLTSSVCCLAAEQTTAVWSDGHRSVITDEELMRYAIVSPGPGYPEEAQKTKATGSGIYALRINKTGGVIEVVIVKSSGSGVLDRAATSAFRKWRFQRAIFTEVRLPVSWSANPISR